MTPSAPAPDRKRLVKVALDENTMGAASRDIEHERAIAIYDLIEENSFAPVGHDGGPYCLALQVVDVGLAAGARQGGQLHGHDRQVVAQAKGAGVGIEA